MMANLKTLETQYNEKLCVEYTFEMQSARNVAAFQPNVILNS